MIPAEARGAWRELETRLRPYVARRVGSTSEVDDIVQDILVKTLGGLGILRDGERFGGWIYRIAEHAIADFASTRARAPIHSWRTPTFQRTVTPRATKPPSCRRILEGAWPSSSHASPRLTAKPLR